MNTLSVTQHTVASSLCLTENLPDATDAYLVQNGSAMASVTGRNTTTLTQANLPNTTFTGSTNNTGSHSHSVSTRIQVVLFQLELILTLLNLEIVPQQQKVHQAISLGLKEALPQIQIL